MNPILEIIEKYDNFLSAEINEENGFENYWKLILLESGGTNYDEITEIIDNILNSLKTSSYINRRELIRWVNKVETKCFLNNIMFFIRYNENNDEEAFINNGKATYNPKTNSLENTIICYNEHIKLFPKYDEKRLKKNLWHELHHAYITYCIRKKEYETQYTKLNYKRSQDIYSDFEYSDKVTQIVKDIMYYSDREEIMSHTNEIFDYIKNNEDINFTNFNRYIQNLPGYDIIQTLKKVQNDLYVLQTSDNIKFKEILNNIGQQIANIYNNQPQYKYKKFSNNQCINYIIRRINNALLFTHRQFYKKIHYSLEKLNRKRYNIEDRIKRGKIDKRGILDRDINEIIIDFN